MASIKYPLHKFSEILTTAPCHNVPEASFPDDDVFKLTQCDGGRVNSAAVRNGLVTHEVHYDNDRV